MPAKLSASENRLGWVKTQRRAINLRELEPLTVFPLPRRNDHYVQARCPGAVRHPVYDLDLGHSNLFAEFLRNASSDLRIKELNGHNELIRGIRT